MSRRQGAGVPPSVEHEGSDRTHDRGRMLLLHTTCCYLDDIVRTLCGLERHRLFAEIEFHHGLVDGSVCPYAAQLPAPIAGNCVRINQNALVYLQDGDRSVHWMRSHLSDHPDSPFDLDTIQQVSVFTTTYKDLNLWEIVKCSVAAYLEWESLRNCVSGGMSDRDFSQVKAFFWDAVKYIDATERLLAHVEPTHCIVFNGHFHRERIAVELCRRRSIAVLAIESSTFRDLKHLSQTGVAGNRNDWALLGNDYIVARRLSAWEKTRLDSFMNRKLAGDGNFIALPPRRSGVRERLRIRADVKVVLFLGQVPHDSAVTSDDLAFCDVPSAIELLLAQFATKFIDAVLVVRLHPGGAVTSLRKDLLADRYTARELPQNVRLVTGLLENTYDLMETADVAITCSSQAGLETLWLGKPLIVLGNPYYAGKGFTRDVTNDAALGTALSESLVGARHSQDQTGRFHAFLYGLIFEYLIPFSRDAGALTERGYQMVHNVLTGRGRLFSVAQSALDKPYDRVD